MTQLKATLKNYGLRLVRKRAEADFRPAVPLRAESWGLSHGAEGLVLDGVPLAGLADAYGAPLHVLSPTRLTRNCSDFLALPGNVHRPHDVFVSYKTAPVPSLLRTVHATGIGAEVISEGELELALSLGVSGSRIIYNGPVKSDESLHRSAVEGVHLVNINHREEVPRVERAAAQAGTRLRVGLRVNCLGGWAGQFGEPEGAAAIATARDIAASPHLDFVAIHVHLGHVDSRDDVRRIASACAGVAADISARVGADISVVDIGGGLRTPTVRELSGMEKRRNSLLYEDLKRPSPADVYSIRDYVADAHESVNAAFAGRGLSLPSIVMEPGRALVGDAQLLITQVKDRRRVEGRDLLILDAGINIADPVRGEFHEIFPLTRLGSPTRRYKLVGPICVPTDSIRSTWYGPELERGDYLAIMDSGAYFVPWSNSFSFPRPAIVSVEDGKARTVRAGETLDYLTALDASQKPRSAPTV